MTYCDSATTVYYDDFPFFLSLTPARRERRSVPVADRSAVPVPEQPKGGAMSGHRCDLAHCDGTRLGHSLAEEFPEETARIDEAFDRLAHPDDYLRAPEQPRPPGG